MRLTPLTNEDLELLLLIRHFEEALLALFAQGKLNGTTHTCLGQEYIPVALCPLFSPSDFLLSNHRGHGHYLARFKDPFGLLAEIMGREGAVCHGVGGSQHIARDHYLSTGVQGESLPVAVGVGLHFKKMGIQNLVAVFIGDGTWGEGVVYEALNMAQLWQIPLLVLVENNNIAQSTPTHLSMAGTIAGRAKAFGIGYYAITSLDVNLIRAEVSPLIERVRTICSPLIIEFATHRLGPHSKGDDTRGEEQMYIARSNDWCMLYQSQFPEQFSSLNQQMKTYMATVVQAIESRALSSWETICTRQNA